MGVEFPQFSVAALLEEEQPFDGSDPKRGGWAHLQIVGHLEYYGFVREVTLFGATMCEVLVPFVDKPGVQIRKTYGGQFIFGCHPASRAECLKWAPYDVPPARSLTAGAGAAHDFSLEADDPDEGDFEDAQDTDVPEGATP